MDNSIIGGQITKFRKAAGLTQEELGRAAGVSTQAVSRWECGGAPDVALLPAIADKLGVTIDALFGREGGQRMDLDQALYDWARGAWPHRFFSQLNRSIWGGMLAAVSPEMREALNYPATCFAMAEHPQCFATSVYEADSGYYYGVVGEDFGFTVLCPKPEKGYDAYLPDPEAARACMNLLARPYCLETVLCLLRQPQGYYGVDILAQKVGIPREEMSALLEALSKTSLVRSEGLGTLRGRETVYSLDSSAGCGFLSLCYLVRCLGQGERINFMWVNDRKKPILEEEI